MIQPHTEWERPDTLHRPPYSAAEDDQLHEWADWLSAALDAHGAPTTHWDAHAHVKYVADLFGWPTAQALGTLAQVVVAPTPRQLARLAGRTLARWEHYL